MNILLVNTNQISIRFVEELLAKNNIHGEIAMVRAGKFALDLVQGMNVDLLVCEIESGTKEKTKHFLMESRKMTPDAYYFILMDGESLEYMEEDFLNSLDDFITIPFEDRALRLRLNRGILACIEKKRKADIAFGRPPVKTPETASVKPALQETLDAGTVSPEKSVESTGDQGLSERPAVPEKKEEAASGSVTSSKRKVPREEFQYEPSYEELLQQRNKNLRKEKEAAWLQAMSSQISSYALEDEPEKPIRIREERKSDPVTPPIAEPLSVIQPEPEIPVPVTVVPKGVETGPPPVVEPAVVKTLQVEKLPLETQPVQADESAATPQKPKSKVKSLLESLSKLKVKSIPQTLQPLLASSGADSAGSEPETPSSYPTPGFLKAPESSNSAFPDAPPAEPSSGSPSETAPEPFPEPPVESPVVQDEEPSTEPSRARPEETPTEQPAQETVFPQDPETPAPSDDVIPEASFLELPVTDEEFLQVSPLDPPSDNPILSDDVIPEESFLELPVTDEEYLQEVPPSELETSMNDQQEKGSWEPASTAGQVYTEEPQEETAQAEAPVEHALTMEQRIAETRSIPEQDEETPLADDTAEETLSSEPNPAPSQVPHLQDEVWIDQTDTLFLEPDDSLDDSDESTEDFVEEDEIFGREENAEISLEAVEDPILEEVLVMAFEEEERPGSVEDLPETPSSPAAEESSLTEEKVMPEDSDDLSDDLPQAEDTVTSQPETTVEEDPEPAPPAPSLVEDPVPPKKESMDLRQYLKESEENEEKDLKSRFRKVFGKRSPS